MGKIRVMSDDLASKIAAGEVVERPASVVKELVENSIDAGADRIEVDVHEGGKRLVRVTDNGEGMDREDSLLAFERHATSKISAAEDLFRIASLGFRGEALPSIVRVSRTEMVTRKKGNETGTRLKIEGGKISKVEEVSSAQGTMVRVEDLFFNTPARRKFLKSESVEYGHIWDVLSRFLLSHNRIHFFIFKDGKEVLNAPPASNRKERAVLVFGQETAESLYEFEFSASAGDIYALASGPSVHRSSSRGLFIFVNGRFVRDRSLTHAVSTAYSRALTRGRWPVAVIYLQVPPHDLDVNVHPSKIEVRFKRSKEVYELVLSSIEVFLTKATWLGKRMERAPVSLPSAAKERVSAYRPQAKEPEQSSFKWERRKYGGAPVYSSLQIIGQSKDTYIITQSQDGLIIIDQHAAAERVCFVRLREGYESHQPLRQLLLIPQTIELSFHQAQALTANIVPLKRLGIELEPFGKSTFLLKAVPSSLVDTDYSALLSDIAESLPDRGGEKEFEKRLDGVLSRMACHSSIRAGRPLQKAEMEHLLRELDQVEFSAFCPHGRPVAHTISFAEIEGKFDRR